MWPPERKQISMGGETIAHGLELKINDEASVISAVLVWGLYYACIMLHITYSEIWPRCF